MIETGTPSNHATPYFIGISPQSIPAEEGATYIPKRNRRSGITLAMNYSGGRDESVQPTHRVDVDGTGYRKCGCHHRVQADDEPASQEDPPFPLHRVPRRP